MEMMIYIAIFSTISVLVINAFIVIISTFNQTRTTNDLFESGSIVMEKLSRQIRQATNIDLANSTFGANPSVLSLTSIINAG